VPLQVAGQRPDLSGHPNGLLREEASPRLVSWLRAGIGGLASARANGWTLASFLKAAADQRGAATSRRGAWVSRFLIARLISFLIMRPLHWLYHPGRGGHSGSEGHS
jgi:F0F1-type ATP synthase membrane subunit c/vacuolar-type H+-ATPase subunit K